MASRLIGFSLARWIKPRTLIFLHDLFMVFAAWSGAQWLRFNLNIIPDSYVSLVMTFMPVVLVIQGVWFRFFGLYRGLWRFASVPDFIRIIKAVAVGTFSIALALFLLNRLEGIPRAVIPLYGMLLLLFLCTPRLIYRHLKETLSGCRADYRALVVGAGRAGEVLVRELSREKSSLYVPVGFVDDDRRKRRSEIHGIRVLGSCRKIASFVDQYKVDVVLIAIPSARDYEMQRIVALCEAAGVPFLTVPSLCEMRQAGISGKTLRDVSIEDLLGRKPVKLAWETLSQRLDNRCIMVTGGGGSIGSELCSQIARYPVERLVIYEKSEYALYQIQQSLLREYPQLKVDAVLGDVADRLAVRHAMRKYKPQLVFHAAAYKHVPLLESQVREAVRNNIIGTQVVASEAMAADVELFTLISTDKVVNPTNVMGACKRVAEMLCQKLNMQGKTRFVTVRFGNVLDSAGSVVPLFREQIARGGPVTVTHPEVTRYFMTIPEASQLIMEAAAVGQGGEIFVLDMGQPIKISYLAKQMILLSGMHTGKEVEIVYTGLRPGEKMHEELFHQHENIIKTEHQKLMLAESRSCDYELLASSYGQLESLCETIDESAILAVLSRLVPEFSRAGIGSSNLVSLDEARKQRKG